MLAAMLMAATLALDTPQAAAAGDKCTITVLYGSDARSQRLKREFDRGTLEGLRKQVIFDSQSKIRADWMAWASDHTLPAIQMQCEGQQILVRCGPDVDDTAKLSQDLGEALQACLHGRKNSPPPPTDDPLPEPPPAAPSPPAKPPVVEGVKMDVSPLGIGITFSVGIVALVLGFGLRALQTFKKIVR
jgi:hypothetical protein